MEEQKEKGFSGLRGVFFPIYKYELKKVLPLSLLFFCIAYNYSVLRGSKDIFILGKSGASAIYYLKTFGVTPAVFLFTIAYSYISNITGRDGRFNIVIGYFTIFFLIYLLIILPNQETLQLNSMDQWQEKLPRFSGFWSIIKNWHTSLFYIHSEAWGAYALAVLFWTFANEIINIKQAKRMYSFLMIGANIGATLAGLSLSYVIKGSPYITLIIVLAIICVIFLVYNYLSKAIEKNPEDYQIDTTPKPKKKKIKLSFTESMAVLFKSPYMLLIAVLVLSYGMSISLFEAVWKDRVQVFAAGNKEVLSMIYGRQLTYIGITTIILIFGISPFVKKNWTLSALITPLVLLIGAFLFFIFMFFGDSISNILSLGNFDTLALAVYIGLANVVFIKGAKYAFFDPTKEQAYIPLDQESKIRGKAAVDGVGSRLGKSLGSIMITFVFLNLSPTGQIGEIKHLIAITLFLVLIGWLVAAINLGVRFKKLTQEPSEKK